MQSSTNEITTSPTGERAGSKAQKIVRFARAEIGMVISEGAGETVAVLLGSLPPLSLDPSGRSSLATRIAVEYRRKAEHVGA
jgi:hypothetical protein